MFGIYIRIYIYMHVITIDTKRKTMSLKVTGGRIWKQSEGRREYNLTQQNKEVIINLEYLWGKKKTYFCSHVILRVYHVESPDVKQAYVSPFELSCLSGSWQCFSWGGWFVSALCLSFLYPCHYSDTHLFSREHTFSSFSRWTGWGLSKCSCFGFISSNNSFLS